MKIDKKQSREKFLTVFPQIVKETTDVLKSYGMPQDAIEWYTKNLNYNTPSGKLNRGLSVVDTYGILKGYETYDDFSEDEYKLSAILGWCIELLQAYFLVADDIMDKSLTRRGHTCWYKVEEVQEIAVNDAFMLEGAIYILLKKYFSKKPYYVKVMELFHDVTFKTECGQLLDLITAPEDKVDLAKFSLNKQMFIITYKTAFYSFYLPVALAMHMAGVDDESDLKQASDVLIPLGQYFQIQDDYLDCFGKPEDIGKIGTDIQDNKCSWVVNTALEICNAEQRKLLDENYGRKDPVKEKKCKDLFIALKIDDRFHQYEEDIVSKIRKNISNIDETRGFKKQTLTAFLDKIYKRKK